MESRFAHLCRRDNSVSMLRVKMSRRRSQSQKENRHRAVNSRRQLDKLPELDCSRNTSVMSANMSIVQENPPNVTKPSKNEAAAIERMERLQRWKENKAQQKDKNDRAKQSKGVFKVGLYQPKDSLKFVALPSVPTATTRAKETTVKRAQNTRVTRSAKPQEQKPPVEQERSAAVRKVEPAVGTRATRSRAAVVQPPPARTTTRGKVAIVESVVQALSTRSGNKPPIAAVSTAKGKPSADERVTRSRVNINQGVPPSGRGKNNKATTGVKVQLAVAKEPEQRACPVSITPPAEKEEKMEEDLAPADTLPSEDPVAPTSFAPQGFVFQAPAGLSSLTGLPSFKFEPLTPRSTDSFLTPSSSFSLPPVFDFEPQMEVSGPSPPKSPHHSPPRPPPTLAPPAPGSPQEPQHDVPYFRSEVTSQTDRLTSLCHQWESKVEDESIPEEMRDRMRTAVGQARLLMKERFAQFIGLVDDCDLGRGEKITTCTDLQGFWDMVFYQVEDVSKKFDALKEAETRSWVEEYKPPPPQRKVVKKRPTAGPRPAGTNAGAAKSRLAAVKAAMKARQQAAEAEKAAQAAGNNTGDDSGPDVPQESQAQTEPKASDTVVFHGGFFQVESPAKLPGSVRKSSLLSAAVSPHASPYSKLTTPGRVTHRPAALSHASPAQSTHTPIRLTLTPAQSPCLGPKSLPSTSPQSQSSKDTAKVSLCFSPIQETPSENTQPEESPIKHPENDSRQDDISPKCQEPKESECVAVPEVSSPVTTQPPQSSPSAQHREGAAENSASLPLSPELPLSPCLLLSPSSNAPESSAALSFTMSPCQAHTTSARPTATDASLPLLSSPYVMPSSPPLVQAPLLAEDSMVGTPDTSVIEGVPGLDFERYLQPSERCSLSPRDTTTEMLSPMATDFEMESPIAHPGDVLIQGEEMMTPTALPGLSLVFTDQTPKTPTPQTQQTAESDLLFFSSDLTGRIRPSVCPSDLMVFTPPSKR